MLLLLHMTHIFTPVDLAGAMAANGHYITIARRCEQWMTCDDANVLLASEAEVMKPNAYMLFYEMCSN